MRANVNNKHKPKSGLTIDQFLLMLDGVKMQGKRWKAKCPAHDDSNASLQITEGDRCIMLKCWSGCFFSEIIESLGLRASDLFYDALSSEQATEYKLKGINKQITQLENVITIADMMTLSGEDMDYYRKSVISLVDLRNERDSL